jgi:hypothetical protein
LLITVPAISSRRRILQAFVKYVAPRCNTRLCGSVRNSSSRYATIDSAGQRCRVDRRVIETPSDLRIEASCIFRRSTLLASRELDEDELRKARGPSDRANHLTAGHLRVRRIESAVRFTMLYELQWQHSGGGRSATALTKQASRDGRQDSSPFANRVCEPQPSRAALETAVHTARALLTLPMARLISSTQ